MIFFISWPYLGRRQTWQGTAYLVTRFRDSKNSGRCAILHVHVRRTTVCLRCCVVHEACPVCVLVSVTSACWRCYQHDTPLPSAMGSCSAD